MEVNMFFKNNPRLAFAGASAANESAGRKASNEILVRDTSETDDFGSFGGQAQTGSAAKGSGKKSPKTSGLKTSSIIIAAAAVVAVILLIVIIVAIVASSSNGNVKFESDTYVSFCDGDGVYHVVANGKKIGDYEDEVTLVTAADRSFAYIIENTEDGYKVYLAEGSKTPTELTVSPVTKVLATAKLSPGLVWLDAENGIYHYTKSRGEERITRDAALTGAANVGETYFYISADAETVVYTKYDVENPSISYLCVYNDSSEQKFQKNMFPVGVSDDGSMIYAYASRDGVTNALYVLPFNDEYDRYLISENFNSIVDTNTKGNEIVFTTIDSDATLSTYVVSFNIKNMDEVAEPIRIGKGAVYTPVSVDSNVARFATFADTYFECTNIELDIDLTFNAPVYYLSKKYEVRRISKFAGKFDPDGKYFYYTNNDNTLQRVDLGNNDAVAEKIAEDIVAFEITQKGNVYWLDDTSRLMYYNTSKEKKTRIADNVESISMYTYSNTLYFTFADAVNVYTTVEGSDKEAAKMDSAAVTGLPVFAASDMKKTFAAFYDVDNEEWRLFYTSNGKTFKKISTCSEIDGFEVPKSYTYSNGGTTQLPDASNTTDTSASTTGNANG